MSLPFINEYHLRTVAEASSKSCMIDFKPTTKVLITPDNKVGATKKIKLRTQNANHLKDFFYICTSHLQDRGFATPKVDPKLEAEKRDREALQKEIELVKKEFEEKQKKKGKKKEDKKEDKKENEGEAEKERDDKVNSVSLICIVRVLTEHLDQSFGGQIWNQSR